MNSNPEIQYTLFHCGIDEFHQALKEKSSLALPLLGELAIAGSIIFAGLGIH